MENKEDKGGKVRPCQYCKEHVNPQRPLRVITCDVCLKELTITAHIEMELPMMKVKF